MKLSSNLILTGLAYSCATVNAFENSSPFIVLSSTKQLDVSTAHESTLSTNEAISSTIKALDKCPADAYILVNQPGLHSSDFAGHSEDSEPAPYLFSLLEKAKSSLELADLYHSDFNSRQELANSLVSQCGAEQIHVHAENGAHANYVDTKPRVITLNFAPLSDSAEDRQVEIRHNDDVLKSVVSYLPSPNFVVVYTSTPNERQPAAAAAAAAAGSAVREAGNEKDKSNTTLAGNSLFENYAFFSPGIFMGLLISLILAGIFMEGLSWLGSMQVSYKAVDPQK